MRHTYGNGADSYKPDLKAYLLIDLWSFHNMNVITALEQRKSTRAFLDKEVERGKNQRYFRCGTSFPIRR